MTEPTHRDPLAALNDPDTRRTFVKKAAYLTPVLMTFPTRLAAAQVGSGGTVDDGGSTGPQCVPMTEPDPFDPSIQQTVWRWVGGPSDGQICSS